MTIYQRLVLHHISDLTSILVSGDGYANSFVSKQDFLRVRLDYFQLIREQGYEYVESHLEEWLREVSELGSGDDIGVGIV